MHVYCQNLYCWWNTYNWHSVTGHRFVRLSHLNWVLHDHLTGNCWFHWQHESTYNRVNHWCATIDRKATDCLLSFNNMTNQYIILSPSAHCPIGKYDDGLGIIANNFCKSSRSENVREGEYITRLICQCSAHLNFLRTWHNLFTSLSSLWTLSIWIIWESKVSKKYCVLFKIPLLELACGIFEFFCCSTGSGKSINHSKSIHNLTPQNSWQLSSQCA